MRFKLPLLCLIILLIYSLSLSAQNYNPNVMGGRIYQQKADIWDSHNTYTESSGTDKDANFGIAVIFGALEVAKYYSEHQYSTGKKKKNRRDKKEEAFSYNTGTKGGYDASGGNSFFPEFNAREPVDNAFSFSEGNHISYYKKHLKFEGEWRDGLPNGKGFLAYPKPLMGGLRPLYSYESSPHDSYSYLGVFSNGKANGYGMYFRRIYFQDPDLLEQTKSAYMLMGNFIDGSPDGFIKEYVNEKLVYAGEYKKGYPIGKGTWLLYNDHLLEAYRIDTRFSINRNNFPVVTIYYSQGHTYKGRAVFEFGESKHPYNIPGSLHAWPQGYGILYKADGSVVCGLWENGQLIEEISQSEMEKKVDEMFKAEDDRYQFALTNVEKVEPRIYVPLFESWNNVGKYSPFKNMIPERWFGITDK